MGPAPDRPVVIHRTLGAGAAACWLDGLRWDEGGRSRFRAFCRAGRIAEEGLAPGAGARIIEVRPVSGALMVTGEGAEPALSAGGEPAPLEAPEWAALAGRNCILAMRLVETVETLCDWLAWHALQHGMNGAVIVNRQAPPQDGLALALQAALDADRRLKDHDLCVILVDFTCPLGKPDQGPETHPIQCPDAPGKDRMVPPADDPWLAPLGEPLIFEVMKWRFLARARAVLTLDCCDLLGPAAEAPGDAFDLCAAAPDGVILLTGRRVYPWRVRPGSPLAFGDHVCRTFDARRGIARWGVSPAKAGLERTWRMIRVAYARPDAAGILPFWRAMGLRAPGWKAADLAPRAALVEDAALIGAMADFFAARPARPPQSDMRAPAPRDGSDGSDGSGGQRTCIVTTMKNEGPFILEWLAYHRAIGVEDFLVYSNDCTDGTDRMLDLLQAKGLLQHRDNPYRAVPGTRPQHAALEAAESEPVVQASDWTICMDVDEFINIRLGDGRLADLYAAMGGANMISLTWRMFGNADVVGYEDRFVTEQFTLAAPELVRKPHQAWGFKTLFRNIDIYRKLGVHRPKGLKPDLWTQVKWLNGSGLAMPQRLIRNGWRSSVDSYGYDWVSLNHYACRSAESFLVKRDRGRVNHTDRDQGLAYWFRMNHNAVEDHSIQTRLPMARAEWDRLMADPDIAAQHRACVAAHRARIAELRTLPDYAALHEAIAGERLQRLSRLLRHFGSGVFAAGPDSIPPDLHRMTLPENFFFTVDHQGDAKH